MLQDNVKINLVEEVDVTVDLADTKSVVLDLIKETSARIEVLPEAVVVVDLESMGPADDDYAGRGLTRLIITLSRFVRGKKSTFARTSLTVNANIQTIGTADINPANHNLVQRQFTFGRVVSAKKTTRGSLAFDIINVRQVQAGNTIGGVSLYGSDVYGVGVYGKIIGYGAGVYGFGSYAGEALHLPIRFGSVVSGSIPIKQTAVAEVSLASHGAPADRESHAIKVKARTVSGSTGVLKAALYEGAVNRSGELTTAPLTNTLALYTLYLTPAAASAITDYSNLSIRFWGYDSAGNALVFQVSEIYLELPTVTGSTKFGAVSRAFTFNRAVSGSLSNKRTATAEISLASHGIPDELTDHTIKLRARTVLAGSNAVIKAALYEGSNNRSGDLITPPLTTSFVDYDLIIPDYAAATITDYSNLSIRFWGYSLDSGSVIFEIARLYLELPVSVGNTTHYGSVSRAITFTKSVAGVTVAPKSTAVAEISLHSHGTPSVRTHHSIKVRARSTTPTVGVLRAQLYEGATLRSGATPLETAPLTTSLTTYTLPIPDASAATISSYANLSIRFWGYDPAGFPIVFEVTELYLELPTP